MSVFWKVMLALLLVLPVGSYVAGSLVASRADIPLERSPIVLSDTPSDDASASQRKEPSRTRSPRPGRGTPSPTVEPGDDNGGDRAEGGSDDPPGDDSDRRDRDDDDDDDDKVKVVRPTPDDLDDRDDDARDREEDRRDELLDAREDRRKDRDDGDDDD